jgi:hypothetical protein
MTLTCKKIQVKCQHGRAEFPRQHGIKYFPSLSFIGRRSNLYFGLCVEDGLLTVISRGFCCLAGDGFQARFS